MQAVGGSNSANSALEAKSYPVHNLCCKSDGTTLLPSAIVLLAVALKGVHVLRLACSDSAVNLVSIAMRIPGPRDQLSIVLVLNAGVEPTSARITTTGLPHCFRLSRVSALSHRLHQMCSGRHELFSSSCVLDLRLWRSTQDSLGVQLTPCVSLEGFEPSRADF